MYVVLAWFSADLQSGREARRSRTRFDNAVDDLVPDSFKRTDFGGDDWHVSLWSVANQGAYRWPSSADDGDVAAVSLGLPIGAPPAATPVGLARALLGGEDVHADIVPPFGLVAIGRSDGRIVLQQDWLGMCRLFTGTAGGLTAFSNRPTLLAKFLYGSAQPSLDGWASYAVTGHFGGDLAPAASIRLMAPGERATWRRGGTPQIVTERRFRLDDLVRAGLDAREDGTEAALDRAAAAFADTAASVGRLYDAPLTLGLSGGKDSRLIAAAFIAADMPPRLHTNDDVVVEADVARHLVEIMAAKRGLKLEHAVRPVGAPAQVLDVGLYERAARLQYFYDFQFPASYLVRPGAARRLPVRLGPLSLTGAGGEIATGYWYPALQHELPGAVKRAARGHLMAAVGRGVASRGAVHRENTRLAAMLGHAASLGLRGSELTDYVYLMERMRRWSTVGYTSTFATPFLSPGVVSAAFALTAEQKRARVLHIGLLRRFVPEWSEVEYVSGSSGRSTATRVWDGDGVATMQRLLARHPYGRLTGLLREDAVAGAIGACAAGSPDLRQQGTLQTFVSLAVAADTFEPLPLRPWAMSVRQRVRRTLRPAWRHARRAINRAASPVQR